MTSDDRWIDMTTFDEELDRLLSGAPPSPEAAAWCSDVAVLVRTARAPARADELAGEADIVARMRALRLDILAGEAAAHAPADVIAAPLALVTDAGEDDAADAEVRDMAGDAATAAGARDAAVAAAGGGDVVNLRLTADEPLTERLRSRLQESDLDEYRAKHGERFYTAKHAAARLEASKYPVARTVGRVVAMKAVAVTTAVVIGVAAAAAATTGIVATVVVPAINDHTRRPVTTEQSPATDQDDPTTPGSRSRGSGSDGDGDGATDPSASVACPSMLVSCPSGVVIPGPTGADATPGASSTASSVPSPATTAPPATTTTSTTVPETTTTTMPDPVSTTTPPTTAPPSDPERGSSE